MPDVCFENKATTCKRYPVEIGKKIGRLTSPLRNYTAPIFTEKQWRPTQKNLFEEYSLQVQPLRIFNFARSSPPAQATNSSQISF
jgi:hypothetical protein